jgi:hypothetical protein
VSGIEKCKIMIILILILLGLILASFLASVLREIGEIKRHLNQLHADVRELIRRIPPDPVKNAKPVEGVTRDVRR